MAAYYLKAFSSPVIEKIYPCKSGWLRDKNGYWIPLWYRGPQIPAVIQRRGECRHKELPVINSQRTSLKILDIENDQEMQCEGEDDFASEHYASSDEYFCNSFDSESNGYESNDPEYLP